MGIATEHFLFYSRYTKSDGYFILLEFSCLTLLCLSLWKWIKHVVVNVQWLSCIWLFVISWTTEPQASLSFIISWSLLRLMSIESVMLCKHLILKCPLLLLPSIFPSIRIVSNDLAFPIRWPKYWSFNFSNNSPNEY